MPNCAPDGGSWLPTGFRQRRASAAGLGPSARTHCFARILFDAVCGRPWREVIPAQAWRNASAEHLRAAIDLGERVLGRPQSSVAETARQRRISRWITPPPLYVVFAEP